VQRVLKAEHKIKNRKSVENNLPEYLQLLMLKNIAQNEWLYKPTKVKLNRTPEEAT
jgi:hypothetical protein